VDVPALFWSALLASPRNPDHVIVFEYDPVVVAAGAA
jgi:hypothetical protein